MLQLKDPAIKLFGQNILLPAVGDAPIIAAHGKSDGGPGTEEEEEKTEKVTEEVDVQTLDAEDPVTETNENLKVEEKEAKPKLGKAVKELNDSTNSQGKPLKKPDKILPCPRCSSMDTKFCYYNNYNINQPRHFCKACQRYWTAGGTMRNVPVGAGRRKNKNSGSHYGHITISEALQAVRVETSTGLQHLKGNGRVLSFAFDSPICNSIPPVFSLGGKRVLPNGSQNGLRNNLQEKVVSVTSRASENGDACSSGSSITVSNSMDEGGRRNVTESGMQKINGFPSQTPYLPGVPWPYPWQPAASPPVLCPPGFPMPFYPTAVLGCGFSGAWNVPLLSPQSSSDHTSPKSDPSPPVLGKHSREDDAEHLDTEKSRKQEKNGCVLVPKTLRVVDPAEAAKSSIWATLGIKNDSLGSGGLFKGVKSKGGEKNCVAEANPILHANPAALCRSQNFHEST